MAEQERSASPPTVPTRALYAAYNGPLYQVKRLSDGKTLDIGVIAGGYANTASQDAFCANTICVINLIYDQSGKGNHLYQAPPAACAAKRKAGSLSLSRGRIAQDALPRN
jgi:hypothetical protein